MKYYDQSERNTYSNGNYTNEHKILETEYNTLKDIFSAHGRVQKIFVPKNKATGQNKGIAFVTMESEEVRDATIAALNETQIDGRTVYVDKAKPRGEVTKKPKGKWE